MDGLPTVDIDYVVELLGQCDKIVGVVEAGNTKAYIFRGNSPIAKRMHLIRCVDSDSDKKQVTYDCAMGIAIKTKQIDPMKDWLKKHRNFNHG